MDLKIRTFSFIILFILSAVSLHSQWVKTLGSERHDFCRALVKADDGGYILVGYSELQTQLDKKTIWISKVSFSGDFEWAHNWGFPDDPTTNRQISIQSITKSTQGTFFLTGRLGLSWRHLFTAHLSNTGEIIWKRLYQKGHGSHGLSVCSTLDGGFIIGGFASIAGRGNDAWVLKFDSEGNILWEKVFGGEDDDEISCILPLEDGGYMLLGNTHSFGAGFSDVWLMKLDLDGEILWQKTYGTQGPDNGYSLEKIADDDFVVAGDISLDNVEKAAWIFRFDGEGDIKWQKQYKTALQCEARHIVKTEEGGFAVAGTAKDDVNSDLLIFKVSESGSIEWKKIFGSEGNEAGYLLSTTEDGRYFVVGESDFHGTDPTNVLLMKFSPEEGIKDCVFFGDLDIIVSDTFVVPVSSRAEYYQEQTFIEEPELAYGGLFKTETICPYSTRKGTRPIR